MPLELEQRVTGAGYKIVTHIGNVNTDQVLQLTLPSFR